MVEGCFWLGGGWGDNYEAVKHDNFIFQKDYRNNHERKRIKNIYFNL